VRSSLKTCLSNRKNSNACSGGNPFWIRRDLVACLILQSPSELSESDAAKYSAAFASYDSDHDEKMTGGVGCPR
jgi:hypothetical protein